MRVIFMGTPDFATGTLEEIVLAGRISPRAEEKPSCQRR